MTERVSVVIPVERGAEWNQERCTSLPAGTPYTVAGHDPGDWAEACNDGVKAAQTDLVMVYAPDAWMEPDCLDFHTSLIWNADMTYGPMVQWADGKPVRPVGDQQFCPNRLYRENYLPPFAVVRRDKYLAAGGMRTGFWDLWVRMHETGARIKYVQEAITARDGDYQDLSPKPTPKESLATFYYQATPGTTYWRCLLPARFLPGECVFNLPTGMEDEGMVELPQQHGAAVMQYAGNAQHHLLLNHLQDVMGVRVLVEADDNYVHWFPSVMKRTGWTRNIEQDNGYSVEGHIKTVKAADGVIVTTDYLAKQYRPFNENVFVCPNQIDPADWPQVKKPDDGVFRIGWFASFSHREDGVLVARALEWASRQPDVEVVLMGVGATNDKPWYGFKYKFVPWSNDLGVYRQFLTELDIGLAPVVGNPWALCRSSLKSLEYGVAQALPVVSDVPPYADVDVLKAKTPKDFLRIIQSLVADRDGTRKAAEEWRDYVLANRTVEKNIGLWRSAVTG